MNYYKKSKLLLSALVFIAFAIAGNNVNAQSKMGSLMIVNKSGNSILSSDDPCEMNVYVQKIELDPEVQIRYFIWPDGWDFVGSINPKGGSMKLYVNENERMRIRVSKGGAREYFWSLDLLSPGHSLRYELFCPFR